jgi:putative phosphoribosyl transferase
MRARSLQATFVAGGRELSGELVLPAHASALVAFSHGNHSSQHSPRNRHVAKALQDAGIATFLMDLLDEYEARDHHNVFDTGLLSRRLLDVARWLREDPRTCSMRLGYFGAATGAAVALEAAAREPDFVSAVVCRGGRTEMAMAWLHQVKAPTLLMVGERDPNVLGWNRDSYARLDTRKELVVVPAAGHLFEEPGALEEVSRHALRWFSTHLAFRAPARAALPPARRRFAQPRTT